MVDTEMMLGMLEEKGYSFTDDETQADIAIVNTCCFIGDAKEESINTLLEMADLKDSGQLKVLIAAGCLAQRYKDEIQKEIPQVDAIIGTTAIDAIVEAVEEAVGKKCQNHFCSIDRQVWVQGERSLTTGGHFAYLKIAEGCNKRCTYCIIPSLRGAYRSAPIEQLVEQARKLVDQGVKELILVAQETTLYGVDLYGEKSLPRLLKELSTIPGLVWIRILYCYPEEITDELIETIATLPKVCHYLDMPIQHCSDTILKKMGRRTTKAQIVSLVEKLRERIPDICIRTTLISGFPGETQEEFEELYNFVDEMEFDRLGVFTYSQEEDTVAGNMPDQIPEEVKSARRDELMELQQEIAFERANNQIGKKMLVMVEGKVVDDDVYVTRTYQDAPNVDGYLFLQSSATLMTGDIVRAVVTDANEYDLVGEIVPENE